NRWCLATCSSATASVCLEDSALRMPLSSAFVSSWRKCSLAPGGFVASASVRWNGFGVLSRTDECNQCWSHPRSSQNHIRCAAGSRHGRNRHNFDEHPGSPEFGREAGPRRRVRWIDPLIPNRVMVLEQTHVGNPDLNA